jgi:hypothetical protein
MSVSYIKLLAVPSLIWKFGWTDELSIDSRMKGIWGLVGSTGGAGCNPEEWAIKGYLRSFALVKVRMALADERTRRTVFLQPAIARKWRLVHHLHQRTIDYINALQFLCAGNIGVAIQQAFRDLDYPCKEVIEKARSVCLHNLHYFDAVYNAFEDRKKYFRTYAADFSRSNHVGVPRIGSRVFVTGAPKLPPMMITIVVSVVSEK